MQDSSRTAQKKNEQLNASKRLIEEQEEEIMVKVLWFKSYIWTRFIVYVIS